MTRHVTALIVAIVAVASLGMVADAQPVNIPADVNIEVADPNCIVTNLDDCKTTWACRPRFVDEIAHNKGVIPYELAVAGGLEAFCIRVLPTPTPIVVVIPAPTAAPAVPVAQPVPAFTG